MYRVDQAISEVANVSRRGIRVDRRVLVAEYFDREAGDGDGVARRDQDTASPMFASSR